MLTIAISMNIIIDMMSLLCSDDCFMMIRFHKEHHKGDAHNKMNSLLCLHFMI